MGYFDFISELRTAKPDIQKAGKAMKALGWLCLAGSLWNVATYYIGPFRDSPFNLPDSFPYLALIGGVIVGALFFRAGRGIREMEPWGKRTGQLAIVLLLVLFFGLSFSAIPLRAIPIRNDLLSLLFSFFYVIVLGQFVLPAYFGIRYLGRLPVKDDMYSSSRYRLASRAQTVPTQLSRESATPETKYKDSPSPFGVGGTFALSLAVLLLLIGAASGLGGPEFIPYAFLPAFLVLMCAPVAYNYVSSPFQDRRTLVASYTGGGSTSFFNGSWPFFRLMVYEDGVEVRVEFHRFFIPYESMADFPEKVGFFSRGLLIASDLPGVPSKIRFSGFGMKNIVKTVSDARTKFLARRKG